MKKLIHLFIIISMVSCKNTKSESKTLDRPFKDKIDELISIGKIDTLLHLRLVMYEEFTTSKGDEITKTASIYSIIDNLEEICSKRGQISKRDIGHEDYGLIVIKDFSNKDSFSYKITFENRTAEEIKSMALSLHVYDIMGEYLTGCRLECNGNDCLNNTKIFLEKDELIPELISVNKLISKVDYFSQNSIFKYSRFSLNEMKIEYQNGKTRVYKF